MNFPLIFALILMGFTSLVVQSLLLREFLITFYGNELTIGFILANWIILEALGSRLSTKFSLKTKTPLSMYALLQILISLYLPLSIFLIRTVKNLLGISFGEGLGILPIITSSFFIIGPLSILDGMEFPLGYRLWSDFFKKPLESAGRVYVLEAIGFILAGPIFTYIFISRLNSFQISFCLGIINIFSALFILRNEIPHFLKKTFSISTTLLFLFITVFLFSNLSQRLHLYSINKQWRNQTVVDYRNSIFANLALIRQSEQYTLFNDGIPIITVPVPDIIYIEELVHFAMLACPRPKNVLILGGGLGGPLKEILKYPAEKVEYAELDPALIEMVRKLPAELTRRELIDPRVEIKRVDGRRFIRYSQDKYDCIILNLPIPTSLQLNRFFTQEFFRMVKEHLKEQGIFIFGLTGSLNYLSEELRNLNGSILNTIKDVFPYINIIPGDVNLYLAADNYFEISPEILLKRLQERNIPTSFLTSSYVEYRLHPRWLNWFKEAIGDFSKMRKNRDLSPCGLIYSLAYWNSLFSPKWQGFFRTIDKLDFKRLLGWLAVIGLAWFGLQMRFSKFRRFSIPFAILTTGFAGMSINLILILAYQSFYGFVFHHIALLVTAFMAGLTMGGWLMTRKLTQVKRDIFIFLKIELGIITLSLAAGPFLELINQFQKDSFAFTFFILSFISGFLVGSEFPLANKICLQKNFTPLENPAIHCQAKSSSFLTGFTQAAGTLYALDLWGAWFACLVIPIICVPVLGILKTCILLAGLKTLNLFLLRSAQV